MCFISIKICDKISYLGRDIEDAVTLKLLTEADLDELKSHALAAFGEDSLYKINTTNLIHLFVYDLCRNSSPEKGLTFSQPVYELMREIMAFNYKNIYLCEKLQFYSSYAESVINSAKAYSQIVSEFSGWLSVYSHMPQRWEKLKNRPVFDITNRADYARAIICYISGMTDHYLKKIHGSIYSF